MRHSGLVFKVLAVIAILTLVATMGGMVYVVKAKLAVNEYTLQLGANFNAAMMVNATETYTDADRAVIAEYEGRRVVIVPENYRQVISCLSRQAAMPLLAFVDREEALHISLCGASDLYAQPDKDGEGFTVEWLLSGKRFVMHTSGGNHWERLLQYCLDGAKKSPNIEL